MAKFNKMQIGAVTVEKRFSDAVESIPDTLHTYTVKVSRGDDCRTVTVRATSTEDAMQRAHEAFPDGWTIGIALRTQEPASVPPGPRVTVQVTIHPHACAPNFFVTRKSDGHVLSLATPEFDNSLIEWDSDGKESGDRKLVHDHGTVRDAFRFLAILSEFVNGGE